MERVWPWEMEVIQERFHLPVAILMGPWSTRWQVQIMETGVGVSIPESWVCHLASRDLAKCSHPLCTLVLPVCLFFICLFLHEELHTNHQRRLCDLKQAGRLVSIEPSMQEALGNLISSAFARKSTCEIPKSTRGWVSTQLCSWNGPF